jgi:hypothetical protein
MALFKQKVNAKKSKLRTAVKTGGIASAAVIAALALVNKSIDRSKIDQLARSGELRAKTNIVSKVSAEKKPYTNMYPKISSEQEAKEMNQVAKILELSASDKIKGKPMLDKILRFSREAGVSPRVWVRTVARSDGKSVSLNNEANRLEKILEEQEKLGNYEGANNVSKELQRIRKIQAVLETVEQMKSSDRSELITHIKKY